MNWKHRFKKLIFLELSEQQVREEQCKAQKEQALDEQEEAFFDDSFDDPLDDFDESFDESWDDDF